MVKTKKKTERQAKTAKLTTLSELKQRNWAVISKGKVCFINATYDEALDLSSDGDSTVVTRDVADRLGITTETIHVEPR
ncbi:MAG TPA: hypothetical protein PKY82_02300 [Pyrinomonadaceae bacterium]|nr:hypothetical protein [Pyrinomonadaceae bacterium]